MNAIDSPPRLTRTYPPDEASSRRRILRYAVPRWMIERATERRLAGDWRGACAAANVEVAFDLADLPRRHRGAVEDDLLHLAPDLLRWHLPRILGGRTTMRTGLTIALRGYAGARYLHVTTPTMADGPQRLRLSYGRIDHADISGVHHWSTLRHLWDVRHTGALLERCGGGDRPPFLDADGTSRAAGDLPTADPGPADPAAHAEWVTSLHERGEIEAAFAAAGIELDPAPLVFNWYGEITMRRVLEKPALALTTLEPEVRRLTEEGIGRRFLIRCFWGSGVLLENRERDRGLLVRAVRSEETGGTPILPEAAWRRLPDLDVLRQGDADPDRLHPLVRAALFPLREDPAGPAGPPDPQLPAPVRVRCRGEWHEVCFQDGALGMPHSEDEQRREQAMRAFGGAVAGCFAVAQAMTSGEGRLPKALKEQRRELYARVQHGDTPGVLALLDAGVDPRFRDGRRRTLLHALIHLDHEILLPRLLEAGVDLEAVDHNQRTALHVAVGDNGSASLVRALLAAGAHPDVIDDEGRSLHDLIRIWKRTDLDLDSLS
ncbi:ankyrin repeat domain-containing protein [Actinomadura sp. DC4]|uniref:ankyrin repeat domain-containing protein n=1 Tax=Actinomadura sp. DC4 TaxID=3055069 RepID=UPI0025B05C30|nr:ankyrin repeat domain-containing protein [Actinomadura sp. DC4]MDN3354147.1 ankyrin repeat domain-containing protein [Actinomadura sp. DC4]